MKVMPGFPIRATKESCELIIDDVDRIKTALGSIIPGSPLEASICRLDLFLGVVRKRLPSEAAVERDRRRKKSAEAYVKS